MQTHKEPPADEPEDSYSSDRYGSGLLPEYIPDGPPPPIPDRSTKDDLPSYIPSETESDFSLPSRIETPQQSGAEISMTGSSNIMLAKLEEPSPQVCLSGTNSF